MYLIYLCKYVTNKIYIFKYIIIHIQTQKYTYLTKGTKMSVSL